MNRKRQDAWTSEEDVKLVDLVLRYIEQGKTQLEAFKVASEILSRTAAACGFRWNATLRKQYSNEVELAKQHRATTFVNCEKSKRTPIVTSHNTNVKQTETV